MESQTQISSSVNTDLELVELFIDPIKGEYADLILNSISGNKVFLSRIEGIDLSNKVVKQYTPLFSYTRENDDIHNPEKSFMELNPDHRYDNSNIIQQGKDYLANLDGLFIIDKTIPKIIPVSFDGSCDVKVSEDSMAVLVDIYPSIGENPITTFEDIVSKIYNMGVKTEIKEKLLVDSLQHVENDKSNIFDLCISEGKYPENGKDGKLENCTKNKEKIENFEFDEFHRVNPVISVKENELIAIVHPPTDGEQGNNIFGSVLNPKPGNACQLKLGKNTCYSEENETQIIAQQDGFINITDSSIAVTDTFTVNGDIDFESGNIVAKGSLKVLGNVKNDFTLKLTKDIQINGYVGDASVEAGENVTIRGGFLGKGNGILKSNGDVELKFVENQKVLCRGSLTFHNDALNAKLFVKNTIRSKGIRSSIIGGHIIAGDSIETYSLGNDSRTETIVEVGFDYLKRNSIMQNKERQNYLKTRLEEVDKTILELARMKRLNPQNKDKLTLLAAEHKNIARELEILKEQNLKITSEIYVPTNSKISVRGTVHPGVKIGINGRFMIIDTPLTARTFILSNDNEVISTHLSNR